MENDCGIPINLKVVPLDAVFPHELTDPGRVDRLTSKIELSDVFTNPPIVIQSEDKYIVLDGATRTASFKKLGFPHIIVQILNETDNYTLKTWYHAIRGMDSDKLITYLSDLSGITLFRRNLLRLSINIFEEKNICYFRTRDRLTYAVQRDPQVNIFDALNKFTTAYINISRVSRTLSDDTDILIKEFPDLTGHVIFPTLTLKQVRDIVDSGNVVPAGITRFVIPGRVMHINADIRYLKSSKSLEEKNKWLDDFIIEKLANDRIRYYAEPMYLFDE